MRLFKFINRKTSGSVAKDRLKLLLVSDRASCSPEIMDLIKNDIVSVISKYIDIDTDGIDIKITQSSGNSGITVPSIFANIPIKQLRK